MRLTLKRAVAVQANSGLGIDDKYMVQARALEGNFYGRDGDTITLSVHTANCFERDGSVSTHVVGGFKKSHDDLFAGAKSDDYKELQKELWSLDNREQVTMKISLSNVDGEEA